MLETIKNFVRWDDLVSAVASIFPHVNRLVLGTLGILAVVIIAIVAIIFT